MRTISLTQGFEAIVDDEDYETLNQFKWHAEVRAHTSYAVHTYRVQGVVKKIYMHRLITGYDYVDHANHNGLDNRRVNLRDSSAATNATNMRGNPRSRSGFKGVSWENNSGRWVVCIVRNGRRVYRKRFNDPLVAALTYDAEVLKIDGPLALTNFYYLHK